MGGERWAKEDEWWSVRRWAMGDGQSSVRDEGWSMGGGRSRMRVVGQTMGNG